MVKTYGLTHIALAVSDASRSSRFYQKVFGAVETYRGDGEVPRGLPKVADLTILLGPDGPTPWPDTRSTQPDV